MSGDVFSRVETKLLDDIVLTDNREKCEKDCKLMLPAIASLRECAQKSQTDVEEGRIVLISTLRLMQRGMNSVENQRDYLKFVKSAERLDGFLREIQQRREVEKLFGNSNNAKNDIDDYSSRNIIQAKSMSVSDWTTVN